MRKTVPIEELLPGDKLTGERGGETKWLDISRDAVLSLLHMMQDEEFRSDKR